MITATLYNGPQSELESFAAETIEEIRAHIADNWIDLLDEGDRIVIRSPE